MKPQTSAPEPPADANAAGSQFAAGLVQCRQFVASQCSACHHRFAFITCNWNGLPEAAMNCTRAPSIVDAARLPTAVSPVSSALLPQLRLRLLLSCRNTSCRPYRRICTPRGKNNATAARAMGCRRRVSTSIDIPHKNGVGTLWPNLNRLRRLVPCGKGDFTFTVKPGTLQISNSSSLSLVPSVSQDSVAPT
jgi:hypothetical protein